MAEATRVYKRTVVPEQYSLVVSTPSDDTSIQRYLWYKQWPMGDVMTMDGDSGSGKTTLIAKGLYIAHSGGEFPDGSPATTPVTGIIYVTGEVTDSLLSAIFRAQGWTQADLKQKLKRLNSVKGKRLDGTEYEQQFSLESKEHLVLLKGLVKSFHANVVVFDPILEFFSVDENNAHNARFILRLLQDLARELDVLIIVVVHWNKNEEASPRNRASGSHQFTATPRARVSIERSKQNPDIRTYRLEKPVEDDQPPLSFMLDEFTGELVWVLDPIARKSMTECKAWLEGKLEDGQPHIIQQMRIDGNQKGYTDRQLKRAHELLGPKIETVWYTNGSYPVQKEAWRLV